MPDLRNFSPIVKAVMPWLKPQHLRVSGFSLAFVVAVTAVAQDRPPPGPSRTPNGMSWGELALLPEYCRDAMGILYGDQYYNTSPRASYWVSRMGQGFWSIHHYCRALTYVQQAESAGSNPTQRRFLYGRAKSDYFYTLNNSDPDMIIVPEILVRLGEAHLKLGEIAEAYAAFEQARQKKPDYWPAYSRWVDVLVGLNKRREARELAERGLEFCPSCAVLQEKFKTLGGDPSKIVPRVPPPAGQAASQSGARPVPGSPTISTQTSEPRAAAEVIAPASQASSAK